MAISKEDVAHVALLARLKLSEEDKERFTHQLSQILEHASKIAEIDTSKVEPTSHVVPVHNVFREDKIKPSLSLEKTLLNAPQREDDGFVVPKII